MDILERIAQWRRELQDYPDTVAGVAAREAIRLCAHELEQDFNEQRVKSTGNAKCHPSGNRVMPRCEQPGCGDDAAVIVKRKALCTDHYNLTVKRGES